MPGITFPIRSSGKIIVIFTGILWTTLTKFPDAFWGGIRLKEDAEAGEKDNTFPSIFVLEKASTITSASCPTWIFFICVSLKLAIIQTYLVGTTDINGQPFFI